MNKQPLNSRECLRYAVASLLARDPKSVPHFIEMPGRWLGNLGNWAWEEGYKIVITSYGRHVHPSFGCVVQRFPQTPFVAIIAPMSRAHAVVMQNDKVIYDPSSRPRKRYQKRGVGIIEFRER